LRNNKTTKKPIDFSRTSAMMQKGVRDAVFPGGVVLVSVAGKILYHEAFGTANLFTGQPVSRDTVFDLASLTKPLATTPAIMRLVQENRLDLEDALADVLPAFQNKPAAAVTIARLLDHTGGLPDYRPYFEQLRGLPPEQRRQQLRQRLLAEKQIAAAGAETVYSDLGFMILGWVAEYVAGCSLPDYVHANIYAPLGINGGSDRMLYFPGRLPATRSAAVAATEQCPWRQMVLEGCVHDDNAHAAGGYDGHAGLFGNAVGIHILLDALRRLYLGEEKPAMPIEPMIVRRFLRPPPDGRRALGFDVPSPENSASGKLFSTGTVGHLGFTGTSFWMDLQRSIIIVLLTNRVHPSRSNEKIKLFRPQIHDTIMDGLHDCGLLF
jgi:CubicO group peptidase (beta-lactamase class C family)